MAVVVEHGGGGSAVAAPIVRDALIEAQRLMPPGAPHHHLVAGVATGTGTVGG